MSGNLTRRSFLGACLCSLFSFLAPWPTLAYERSDHDSYTETILFDKTNAKIGLSQGAKESLAVLESAIQLCLDQVTQNQSDLKKLEDYPVYNVPKLEEISLPHISVGDHDKYTHMGWRHDYGDMTGGSGSDKYSVQDRWVRRKRLLVDTVNTVFDFGFIDSAKVRYLGWSDGTKCDALAELLYYTHVLGDLEDNINDRSDKASKGEGAYKMDFQGIAFAVQSPSDDNRDFFWDLEESLRILFGTEADSLIEKIESTAARARRIGTVSTKTDSENFKICVKQLKQKLRKNLPELLDSVDYWHKVFN